MVIIKKASQDDIVSIKEIETECLLSPWKSHNYALEIAREQTTFLVAKENSYCCGYILARFTIFDESISDEKSLKNIAEILNIGVRREYRRRRIGSRLLNQLIKTANHGNINEIYLEARRSNIVAADFYSKFGFQEIGVRKNFYSNPVEDAILYKLEVTHQENLQLEKI